MPLFRFAPEGSRSPAFLVGLGTFDYGQERDISDPRELELARAHGDLEEITAKPAAPDEKAAGEPEKPARSKAASK